MLVGFLASTLDLFEVHFHVLYIFCVRKAFCHASHVRLSCKFRIAELQFFSFCRFSHTLTCPTKKKGNHLQQASFAQNSSWLILTLRTWQGFMALGHRDPTAPGVCVALDLHEKHLMWCFFVFWKKQTLSESGQYHSRYYEHLHLKHMYYVA